MLTSEQIVKKQEDLQKLEAVQLQLMSGELAVSTVIDGNSVTFQKIYPGKLESYIARIKSELAPYDTTVESPVREFIVRNNSMFC
jgi:hypothetical protein